MSDYKNIVPAQDTFDGTSLARMKQPFIPHGSNMYQQNPPAFLFPTYAVQPGPPQPLLGMAPQYSFSPQQPATPVPQYSSAAVTPSVISPPQSHHQPLHILSSVSLEESSSSGTGSLASNSASLPQQPSPPLPKEKDPQIIYWQEFMQYLEKSGAGMTDRPGTGGCLPDGRFYTPKTSRKDHYFIFNLKGDYIAHFVHYYFSVNNMMRDTTLQNLLEEGGALPVESLLLFPKLSQIETSEEDLAAALMDSPKVKIVTLTNGKHAVRRIDGWSPVASSSNPSSTPSSWSDVSVTASSTPVTPTPAPQHANWTPQQQQQPTTPAPHYHQIPGAYAGQYFVTDQTGAGMYAHNTNLQPMMHSSGPTFVWDNLPMPYLQPYIPWQPHNPTP